MESPAVISKSDCEKIFKQLKLSDSFILDSYTLRPIGETMIGFLGSYYILTLSISSSTNVQRVNFFVKTTPKVDYLSKYVEEIGAFRKEVSLFEELMPQLQKSTEFLEDSWSAKCFASKSDVLVFEDLSQKGYRMGDGTRGIFDTDHCLTAIKTLADFHSATIIWEKKHKTRVVDRYPFVTDECTYVQKEGHTRYKWLKAGIDALEHLCKLMGHDSTLIGPIITKATADIGVKESYCNVISHGDLWGNNFMFSYKDGKVNHCVLVDFQLSRYAPCALDLICCIHLITTREQRNSYYSKLVDTYYRRLESNLKNCSVEVRDVMTFDRLLKDCEEYKKTALSEALLYGISIWLPLELSSKAIQSPSKCLEITLGDRKILVEKAYKKDLFYKKQITDLMDEILQS